MNGEIIKYKVALYACALLAPFTLSFASPAAHAAQKTCPEFNFTELFYADYKSGTHWDNSSGNLQITWSTQSTTINDEISTRPFTANERTWLRTAFNSWDIALKTISFVEVAANESPQITIGYVDLNPSIIQPGAVGFWTSWASNGLRNKATIKLKSSKSEWFSQKNHFIHTVQHELGNVLGLGDITPTKAFNSVLEDPWQPPYGRSKLSATDISLIKQLYAEPNTCS